MKKLLALLLLVSTPALAQDNKLLIAAASSSGTYSKMLSEIMEFCSSDALKLEEIKLSGGATDNLQALVNNKVSAAFLHSDVIFAMAQAEPKYRQLKTLIALYPEEIHVLTLRDPPKQGGRWGIGGKTPVINSLADLKSFKVAAAGGGAITAKVLTGQGEAHFDVVEKPTGKDVIAALDQGEVQGAIFVGGAPLHALEPLDGNKFKLIPIPESIANKLSGVYRPASVNYSNLRSGTVKTLSADAIILTRVYKSPRMRVPQQKFRDCFYEHLDELKEIPGKHPKWQQVDPNNHGVWEWYELASDLLPAPAVAAPEPTTHKRK